MSRCVAVVEFVFPDAGCLASLLTPPVVDFLGDHWICPFSFLGRSLVVDALHLRCCYLHTSSTLWFDGFRLLMKNILSAAPVTVFFLLAPQRGEEDGSLMMFRVGRPFSKPGTTGSPGAQTQPGLFSLVSLHLPETPLSRTPSFHLILGGSHI